MERERGDWSRRTGWSAAIGLLLACAAGAVYVTRHAARAAAVNTRGAASPAASKEPMAFDLVLAPESGTHPLDERIRTLQRRIPTSRVQAEELEQLGWTFIARARELDDPGSYQLALASARVIEAREPGSRAALLLRGHALHSLHRFAEAEQVARRLVEQRGLPHDYGLLGDVLADRGELDEAVVAYQRMMDLRPDMHAYARAAHVRYLKGDLPGAIEAMELAAKAASPRNRESFAWVWSKLALYELQAGKAELARATVDDALAVFPDSVPALRASALLWLAAGDAERALAPLRQAAAASPHPETLWLLSDALQTLGRSAEEDQVRAQLVAGGEREDPRAFALYLATRGEQLDRAEALIRGELAERGDVYTYEALAWVQSARGQRALALQSARRSLAAGTQDARLYYHAGLIAERAGEMQLASQWLARADALAALLLPSQRAELRARSALQ